MTQLRTRSATMLLLCFAIISMMSCSNSEVASDLAAKGSSTIVTPPPCGCTDSIPGAVNITNCSMGNPGSISLTWDAMPGADGYEVWRRTQVPFYPWEHNATITCTSYCDSFNLEECNYYEYKVRAFNCAGHGAWSAVCIGWIGMNPDDCGDCPPPPEECGPCEGKVTQLTLQYGGSSSTTVTVSRKKDGANIFSGTVAPGGQFSITGNDKNGTLGTEIKLTAGGTTTSIHTSCSQPIGPGMTFGPFTIISGASLNGGPLCPGETPPPPSGGGSECDGKVSALTLQWNGTSAAQIEVRQTKGGIVVFSGNVPAGGSFSFSGQDDKGTLGTNIDIYVNGVINTSIHTSCSQPIGTGQTWGNFTILAGASLNGGPLPFVGGTVPGTPKSK